MNTLQRGSITSQLWYKTWCVRSCHPIIPFANRSVGFLNFVIYHSISCIISLDICGRFMDVKTTLFVQSLGSPFFASSIGSDEQEYPRFDGATQSIARGYDSSEETLATSSTGQHADRFNGRQHLLYISLPTSLHDGPICGGAQSLLHRG